MPPNWGYIYKYVLKLLYFCSLKFFKKISKYNDIFDTE